MLFVVFFSPLLLLFSPKEVDELYYTFTILYFPRFLELVKNQFAIFKGVVGLKLSADVWVNVNCDITEGDATT